LTFLTIPVNIIAKVHSRKAHDAAPVKGPSPARS
jgi:hypothetical protein